MSEREHTPRSPEHTTSHHETAEAAGERLKQLEARSERPTEGSQERSAEHARIEAKSEALFSQEAGAEQRTGTESDAPSFKATTKKQKKTEYDKTMKAMQSNLSSPSRTFSKIIHNPTIEKTSEVTGATIARPNAILAGSFMAFVAVLAVYIIARYIGFRLSGFETIAAFILGWALGMLLDGLRVAILRRRIS